MCFKKNFTDDELRMSINSSIVLLKNGVNWNTEVVAAAIEQLRPKLLAFVQLTAAVLSSNFEDCLNVISHLHRVRSFLISVS